MLTEQCKLVLDYLIQAHTQADSDLYSENLSTMFPAEVAENIGSILHFLDSQNYIVLKEYISGSCSISLTHKGLKYQELENKTQGQNISHQTFNIHGDVSNSAFGNTGSTTINNGMSFDDARVFIESQKLETDEQNEVLKMVEYIEILTENDAPLKKGFLSKFSDTVSKHAWIPTLIGNVMIRYFMG